MTRPKQITKTKLAQKLGVSRSSLYYKPKLPGRDEEVRHQIEAVLTGNPEYGHKRIAIELKLNKKRILRVMRKFEIRPRRRKVKKPKKPDDLGKEPSSFPNVSQEWCPVKEGVLWASDFTYLYFQGRFFYLATIIDVHTREIMGYHLARHHQTNLVLSALEDALNNHHPPVWIHSDQGSEYNSKLYINRCQQAGISISMSAKGSPWHNPFQESFYDKFKITLGFLDRFENLGELVAAIHEAIYYYNHKRIHTALKMSPIAYKQTLITNDRLAV
jgi:putative transposase